MPTLVADQVQAIAASALRNAGELIASLTIRAAVFGFGLLPCPIRGSSLLDRLR